MKKSRKAKYESGMYLLTVFDEFGGKLSAQNYVSFDQAHDVGKDLEKKLSFVISRVLFNSKIPTKQKWDVK